MLFCSLFHCIPTIARCAWVSLYVHPLLRCSSFQQYVIIYDCQVGLFPIRLMFLFIHLVVVSLVIFVSMIVAVMTFRLLIICCFVVFSLLYYGIVFGRFWAVVYISNCSLLFCCSQFLKMVAGVFSIVIVAIFVSLAAVCGIFFFILIVFAFPPLSFWWIYKFFYFSVLWCFLYSQVNGPCECNHVCEFFFFFFSFMLTYLKKIPRK